MNRKWDWWPDDEADRHALVPSRGFRAPLDVSEYVARVEGAISSAYGSNTATIAETQSHEYDQPMLFGRSDMADASTCTDLVVTPGVIWDVNGYYRTLGIPFPHRPLTRKALMRAYQAVQGENDPWTTYCFNQLLDERVRREYDAMPPGEPFMDDRWEEYFRNEASKEAYRRVARGELVADEVDDKTAVKRILREWGLDLTAPGEEPPPRTTAPTPRTVHLTWSYYLWRCGYQTVSARTQRLDAWRSMLVGAFREKGMHIKFRVGFLGKEPHPWMRIEWDGALVFFLNVNQVPTVEYAAQAAEYTQRELGITPTR